MTDKTTATLKLAEEALVYHTQQTRPIQKTDEAIAVIRKARAEQDHIAEAGKMVAEPVKQKPVVYYAYATIKEYEELAGFSVSQAFRAGWYMARTTNSMLGINAAPVSAKREWVDLEPWQLCEIEERVGLPIDSHDFETIGNAYITAFKEKNK